MSLLSELEVCKGATSKKKRVGRGNGSGWGKTSGKGHKGQKARSGTGKNTRGFEGGQTPLARRLPKFGFTNNRFKVRFDIVSLDQLNKFDGEVTPETLKAAGVAKAKVKILANGDLTKSLTVKAHKFSAKAKEAIEAAGGKAEVIG